MNILQIVPKLEIGGVERGTVDLARYLTLNAHKAVVISEGGKLVKGLDEVGARHYVLPIGRKNPFIMLVMVFSLREIIRRENIDIIHARSRVPALVSFLASRLTYTTFITTAHGQYRRHLMSYVMGWGKYVIVASSVMARHMIENFGVRQDKIRVIPRGVDTKKFFFISPRSKKNDEFTVGMISRISPLKGHIDFIKAVSILSRSIHKLKVYIVGNKDTGKADYVRQIDLLIKRLALNNVIEFVNETSDVPQFMSKLDVLVSANREQEAFGRVLIEAESCGVPTVATEVGGVVDIIEHQKTGLLCKPHDPHDMAEKIITLYRDMGLRTRLARNARKSVMKNFTVEKMMRSTLDVYEKAKGQVRILIIKVSALGDVILSLPSLRAIREKYPKAVIKVLVGLGAKDILKNCPYIDDIIVCDFAKRDRGLSGLWRLARLLKNEDFDVVVDFQNNKKSHLLAFFSCAALRYGYDNGKYSFLLNRKIKDPKDPMDPVEHQMRVLALMGIYNVDKNLALFPNEDDAVWVEKFLGDNWIKPSSPFVCINLESSPKWVSKRWPVDYFVEFAERLAKEESMRVIVIGKDAQDDWNIEFMEEAKCKPISSIGKTNVGQVMALVKRCSVLVTADSAPMHMASGLNTPFVALFGPTDPKRHVPEGGRYKVLCKKTKCHPCYKQSCHKRNRCMDQISPDEVFDAVRELLSEG